MYRAGTYTIAASGALVQVNKSRLLTYSYLEIAFFTGQLIDFGASDEINI
jgi:hypothetical protein